VVRFQKTGWRSFIVLEVIFVSRNQDNRVAVWRSTRPSKLRFGRMVRDGKVIPHQGRYERTVINWKLLLDLETLWSSRDFEIRTGGEKVRITCKNFTENKQKTKIEVQSSAPVRTVGSRMTRDCTACYATAQLLDVIGGSETRKPHQWSGGSLGSSGTLWKGVAAARFVAILPT